MSLFLDGRAVLFYETRVVLTNLYAQQLVRITFFLEVFFKTRSSKKFLKISNFCVCDYLGTIRGKINFFLIS